MHTAHRYLLLGGAPKCGTTSLFRYLSDHPDVCPSHRKETYFFAREFDLKKVCQLPESLEGFKSYFSHCASSTKLCLEGTPYTLYSKNAALKIKALLKDVSILFILRDPVQRLVSDYLFQSQRGHPSTLGSVQDWLKWQDSMKGDIPNLIEQGCYIRYIRSFIEIFGKDNVIVLFFEDLIANSNKELQKVCALLDIDPLFYSAYNFGVHNPTINYRSSRLNRLYMRLEPGVANVRSCLMNNPKMHRLFEQTIDYGKSVYRLINNQKLKKKTSFPPELLRSMADYYQPYNGMLAEEIGQDLPWAMAVNT